jgi:hypothetical protein
LYGQIIQLFHVKSHSFLHVSVNQISETERNASAVLVGDESGSISCQFQIMPRYKVRSIGDRVAMDDQVVLVSVKRGLRLHVSPNKLPDHDHEVTASQTDESAAWRVCRYTDHNPAAQRFVMSGSVIRLKHTELEV